MGIRPMPKMVLENPLGRFCYLYSHSSSRWSYGHSSRREGAKDDPAATCVPVGQTIACVPGGLYFLARNGAVNPHFGCSLDEAFSLS